MSWLLGSGANMKHKNPINYRPGEGVNEAGPTINCTIFLDISICWSPPPRNKLICYNKLHWHSFHVRAFHHVYPLLLFRMIMMTMMKLFMLMAVARVIWLMLTNDLLQTEKKLKTKSKESFIFKHFLSPLPSSTSQSPSQPTIHTGFFVTFYNPNKYRPERHYNTYLNLSITHPHTRTYLI